MKRARYASHLCISSGIVDHQYQLFFWFFPPGPEGSLDDLIFWSVDKDVGVALNIDRPFSGRTGVRDAHLWRVSCKRTVYVSFYQGLFMN
jgi:hypothetical protein